MSSEGLSAIQEMAELRERLAAAEARAEETEKRMAHMRSHHAAVECGECGEEDCVYNDPLHYHHDSCPSEWAENEQLRARLAEAEARAEEAEKDYRDMRRFQAKFVEADQRARKAVDPHMARVLHQANIRLESRLSEAEALILKAKADLEGWRDEWRNGEDKGFVNIVSRDRGEAYRTDELVTRLAAFLAKPDGS